MNSFYKISFLLFIAICFIPSGNAQLLQTECGNLTFTADQVPRITNAFVGFNFVDCGDCNAPACEGCPAPPCPSTSTKVLKVGRYDNGIRWPFIHRLYKRNASGLYNLVDGPINSNIAKRTWKNLSPGIYFVMLDALRLSDTAAVTFFKSACEHRGYLLAGTTRYYSNLMTVGPPVNYLSSEQMYCPDEEIIMDGGQTIGEDGYLVTICQRPLGVTSGPCIRWAGSGWQTDAQVSEENLNDIWQAAWIPKFTYEVMLATYNQCSSWTAKSNYFNIGFPPEIKVNPIANCEGQVNLSFPKHDCFESFSWDYTGINVEFEETESADWYYLSITAQDHTASYSVLANLESSGESHTYSENGVINSAVILPPSTPAEINNLCPGDFVCVDLSFIDCLEGLKIESVNGAIQAIQEGTTLCVIATSFGSSDNASITLSAIGPNGNGPSVTWNIDLNKNCGGKSAENEQEIVETQTELSPKINMNTDIASAEVWPNPFDQNLNIKLSNSENGKNHIAQIISMNGQIIRAQAIDNSSLNTSDLPSGLYLIKIVDEINQVIHSQKIIKQ